jgi:hypothetical protein
MLEHWVNVNPSFHVGGIKPVSLKDEFFKYTIEVPEHLIRTGTGFL